MLGNSLENISSHHTQMLVKFFRQLNTFSQGNAGSNISEVFTFMLMRLQG